MTGVLRRLLLAPSSSSRDQRSSFSLYRPSQRDIRLSSKSYLHEYRTCFSRTRVVRVTVTVFASRATASQALLSLHTAFHGHTLETFFMFPMFPNLVFVIVIWTAWVIRFGGIPHCELLYILILEDTLIMSCVRDSDTYFLILPAAATFTFRVSTEAIDIVIQHHRRRLYLFSPSCLVTGARTYTRRWF